jgi:hypothetical protein
MEWVVRGLQEPRRLGQRYARDVFVFGPAFAAQWRAGRRQRRGVGLRLAITATTVTVRFGGTSVPPTDRWQVAAAAVTSGSALEIDAGTAAIRIEAIAQLVGLVRLAERSAGVVDWLSDPDVVVDSVTAVGADPELIRVPPQ